MPEGAPIDFQDLELAFRYKSDEELNRAYRGMKMAGSQFMNQLGPPLLTFAFRIGFPVKGYVRRTVFDIFCGGETLEETKKRSEALFRFRVLTILDYSVEGEKSETGFDATRDEILRTLQHASQNEAVAFSALKVTGIAAFDLLEKAQHKVALSAEEQSALLRGKARLDAICSRAAELRQPVFIDAEESWIQDTIDAWAEEMMARYNRGNAWIYTTAQMYRHDRLVYLQKLTGIAASSGWMPGVKVVRGAYLEKENARAAQMGYATPIHRDKASTDRDFDAALQWCVEHVQNLALCAGTHNEKSAVMLTQLMAKANLPPDHPHILCAQLLGMSDNISFVLAHHGYRVGKYLPYGPVKAVLPYLIRRAKENSSIAGQSGRELTMLGKELARRNASR
jgi:proline dehydrogenase